MPELKRTRILRDKPCEHCGVIFRPNGHRSKWCSVKCILAANSSPGPNGCIDWSAAVMKRGYGQFTYNGRAGLYAHVHAYMVAHGPVQKGLVVRHRCDRPSCINPNHLLIGTQTDNMRDMIVRGRARHDGPRGESNGISKMTWIKVTELRALRKEGWAFAKLGKLFGISATQACNIASGKSWAARR